MARKGKFLKKPNAGGVTKGENDNDKAVVSQGEKSKGKPPAKKWQGQADAAKKQISGDLGGFIFMCNGSTKPDCFKYRVFGLNEGKRSLVEQVRKGMRLFLFDVDLRLLYGIYVAASHGTYKLEQDAFGGGFPWQVRFSIQKDCLPLPEDLFQAAIKENYVDKRKFKVELTTEQVHRLVKLFRPLPNPVGRSPPRQRKSGLDQLDVAPKPVAPRVPEIDRYAQDRLGSRRLSPRNLYERRPSPRATYERRLSPRGTYERRPSPRATYERHLSPRATYESSLILSDPGRLLPLAKYETTLSDRFRAEKPSYSQSLTKYAQLYPPEERRLPDGLASNDLYYGRESRLQQDTRARDDLLSAYPQGSTLGTDMDSLYRQRLRAADVRGDTLDRRVTGLDPLVESSLAYSGGLSSDLLRGRASDIYASSAGYGGMHRIESVADPLSSGLSGASGLAYRVLSYGAFFWFCCAMFQAAVLLLDVLIGAVWMNFYGGYSAIKSRGQSSGSAKMIRSLDYSNNRPASMPSKGRFVVVFAIVLAGFGLQQVFASRLPDMAARTPEFELFVTRFDGSNFAWWSSHMLDALTCLGQALPLQGKDARPESMSDRAWVRCTSAVDDYA
ncbi:hypothetical protein L7F22_066827 [Adiantum nelumboides]|nr:hypothetical protein [Adiantum nelumboides]